MKKKIFELLLTLIMACAAVTLNGCGNNTKDSVNAPAESEAAGGTSEETGASEEPEETEEASETSEAPAQTQEATEEINYAGLADELAALVKDDDVSQVDNAMAAATYGIDAEKVQDCKVFLSSGATASEIAVFAMKDEEGVNELLELINQRIEERKTSFADYAPDEVPKLENAVLLNKDNYVVFAVVADPQAAEDVIKKY